MIRQCEGGVRYAAYIDDTEEADGPRWTGREDQRDVGVLVRCLVLDQHRRHEQQGHLEQWHVAEEPPDKAFHIDEAEARLHHDKRVAKVRQETRRRVEGWREDARRGGAAQLAAVRALPVVELGYAAAEHAELRRLAPEQIVFQVDDGGWDDAKYREPGEIGAAAAADDDVEHARRRRRQHTRDTHERRLIECQRRGAVWRENGES